MELEFYIPKLGLIPRCIRPVQVRPVADLYDLLARMIIVRSERRLPPTKGISEYPRMGSSLPTVGG